MNWYSLWIYLGICVIYTEPCSPPHGWTPISPEERAKRADIVVYGTVVSTPKVNQSLSEEGRFYSVLVRVHCTIKGPKIPEYVRVSGFSRFTGGLCVHTKASLNKSYIIFAKRKSDKPEQFKVFEVNLQIGAVHPGHKLSVLRDVMFIAGENASLPLGVKSDSKPGCPHFKRRFRDPTSHRSRQKNCRRRKKKHKRPKKRKRIKASSRPRKPSWSVNEVPTLPRTRRYSSVLTDFDDNIESFDNTNSQSVEAFALRSNSRQLNIDWFIYLLTIYWVSMALQPT